MFYDSVFNYSNCAASSFFSLLLLLLQKQNIQQMKWLSFISKWTSELTSILSFWSCNSLLSIASNRYIAPSVTLAYLYIHTAKDLRPPNGELSVMMYEQRADIIANRHQRWVTWAFISLTWIHVFQMGIHISVEMSQIESLNYGWLNWSWISHNSIFHFIHYIYAWDTLARL